MSQDLSSSFQTFLQQTAKQCATIADAMQGSGARVWMVPEGEWSPFKPDTIAALFDREESNQAYQDALHSGGAMGQATAAKIQIDHLARNERAFRMRHTPLVRAAMHAAARRQGHGNQAGVHIGVVQQYVQNFLKVSQRKT